MKIVLVNPLIPPNTGSIGRLCAATNTQLVLVEPLGFSLEDRYLKRAGLDYWPWIDLVVTDDWRKAIGDARPWLFTRHATRPFTDVQFTDDDALVFGSETDGLPAELLAHWPEEQRVCIPMENENVRSLNLAQCAAVGLYEARRQLALGGAK